MANNKDLYEELRDTITKSFFEESLQKFNFHGRKEEGSYQECPICLQDDGHETALIPCGHVVCNMCTSKISRCPFCRTLIHRELRLFKEK